MTLAILRSAVRLRLAGLFFLHLYNYYSKKELIFLILYDPLVFFFSNFHLSFTAFYLLSSSIFSSNPIY